MTHSVDCPGYGPAPDMVRQGRPVRVLVLLAGYGPAPDMVRQGRPVGALEDLCLEGLEGEWSRLLVSLTARAGPAPWTTDGGGPRQGPSGSCSQRIAWSDDLRLGGTGGRRRGGFVKARLRLDAKGLDWRLSMLPGRIEEIRISVRVDRRGGSCRRPGGGGPCGDRVPGR
jgi:hypothetical protein